MRDLGTHNRKMTGARIFFLCYFVIVLVIFLIGIFSAGSTSYSGYTFGTGGETQLPLTDPDTLELVFYTQEDHAWGLTLDDYYDNEYVYTEEYLTVQVNDPATGETDQNTIIKLADQYSEALYSTRLYIPFEKDYPAGTKLQVLIRTHGIDGTGDAAFSLRVSSEALYASSTRINASADPAVNLNATVYYETVTKDYVKPIIFFVIELLTGLLLLYLHRALALPVFPQRKEKKAFAPKKIKWRRIALRMLLLAGGLFVFWDYVSTFSVERAVKKQDAAFLCSDRNAEYVSLVLKDGEEVSQTIMAEKNNFSGIGIWVSQLSKDDDTVDATDTAAADNDSEEDVMLGEKGKIVCQVYDTADDSLVASKTARIDSLPSFSKTMPNDLTDAEQKLIKKYRWLDLGTVLKGSAGHQYRIVLSTENVKKGIELETFYGEKIAARLNGIQGAATLCLLPLYQTNGFLLGMYRCVCVLLTVFACLVLLIISVRPVSVEAVFLPSILVLGFVFSFLIPPYCVPDERSHIDTVYAVSDQILGIPDDAGPAMIYVRSSDIAADKDNTMSVTADAYRELSQDLFKKAEDATLVPAYIRNSLGNVTQLHYLPAAIGFSVARLLGLNRITMIMFGRWLNLLVMGLLIWLGIRKMPFAKAGYAIIGLLPMMLQQIASCSYDGLILAATYLFIGYCISIIFERGGSVADWLVMLAFGGLLALSKGGVYLPIVGLILLIPFYQKQWKASRRWLVTLGSLALIGGLFITQFLQRILGMFFRSSSAVRLTSEGSSVKLYTLGYFIEKPKQLIRILQNTIYVKGDNLLGEILGSRLGKLNIYIPWFLVIAFFGLLIISICRGGGLRPTKVFHKIARIYTLFLAFCSFLLITMSMLLAWTRQGLEYVDGLQGRYYLPLLLMVIVAMSNKNEVESTGKGDVRIIAAANILLCFVIGNCWLSTMKV